MRIWMYNNKKNGYLFLCYKVFKGDLAINEK